MSEAIQRNDAYWRAEEALYWHEIPYYSYCASGFPMRFSDKAYCAEWQRKREVLMAEVERLRPETAHEKHVRLSTNPKLQAVSDGR